VRIRKELEALRIPSPTGKRKWANATITAIIEKACFKRVQEMRRLRTNVEINEQGNRVRKNTHYSMKRPLDEREGQAESGKA
jgi:hypothetical protein